MTGFDITMIIVLIALVIRAAMYLYSGGVLFAVILIFTPIVAGLLLLVHKINTRKQRKKQQESELLTEEIQEIFGRMHQYSDDAQAAIEYMQGKRKDLPPNRPIPLREEEIVINPKDSLEDQVIAYILQSQTTAVGGIQRRFRIGLPKAQRILDRIEALGIIGEYSTTTPREINVSYEEWLEKRSYYEALRMER